MCAYIQLWKDEPPSMFCAHFLFYALSYGVFIRVLNQLSWSLYSVKRFYPKHWKRFAQQSSKKKWIKQMVTQISHNSWCNDLSLYSSGSTTSNNVWYSIYLTQYCISYIITLEHCIYTSIKYVKHPVKQVPYNIITLQRE